MPAEGRGVGLGLGRRGHPVRCRLPKPHPRLERRDRAELWVAMIGPDRDNAALSVLVGFAPAHQHAQAAVLHDLDVAEFQRDDFRAAQCRAEADEQHGAMAGGEGRGGGVRRVGSGQGGQQAPQYVGNGGGGPAPRPHAVGADNALHDQAETRIIEIEWHAGQAMGGADGRARYLQAGDGQAVLGAFCQIEREQAGIAVERLASDFGAPVGKCFPGRSVGRLGAWAAGVFRIPGGAFGKLRQDRRGELSNARRARNWDELPETGRFIRGQASLERRLSFLFGRCSLLFSAALSALAPCLA